MLSTPDVTKAQILAIVQWIASQAVALGYLDANQAGRWVQIGSTVVLALLMISDAIIRHGRASAQGGTVNAGVANITPAPAVEVDPDAKVPA